MYLKEEENRIFKDKNDLKELKNILIKKFKISIKKK